MSTSSPADNAVWRGVIVREYKDPATGKKELEMQRSRPYDTKGPAKRWVSGNTDVYWARGKVVDQYIEFSEGWSRFE